ELPPCCGCTHRRRAAPRTRCRRRGRPSPRPRSALPSIARARRPDRAWSRHIRRGCRGARTRGTRHEGDTRPRRRRRRSRAGSASRPSLGAKDVESARMSVPAPTFADVLAAKRFLASYLSPTPLVQRPAVGDALGLDIWLKCESLLPTAAFKVRGGLNLVGRDPTARGGVYAASTGNHGQSLAYAGKQFGVPVTIFHPRAANALKLAAMHASGATLVEHGADFDEARVECERRAKADGVRYVHSGDEPYLIAGVGTATLEVLEALPNAD